MARSVADLHSACQRHANHAARAERQVRDLTIENQRLRRRIALAEAPVDAPAGTSPC